MENKQSTQVSEIDASAILENENRAFKARRILDLRPPLSLWLVPLGVSAAIMAYMFSIKISFETEILVFSALSMALMCLIETWWIGKRLNAAIDLLKYHDIKMMNHI